MTALTERLLRERTRRLFERLEPHLWSQATDEAAVVICDRCGHRVDLLAEPLQPGWTTSGSHQTGWTDLCRGCSS
jgi:hypothetical protein